MTQTESEVEREPLPEDYPLFDVDDVDLAFSTAKGHVSKGGRYLSRDTRQCYLVPRAYQDKADRLFYRGGSLADIGLKPREGNDPKRIMRALRYLLSSWEPSAEEKSATVGFALMKWCEPI